MTAHWRLAILAAERRYNFSHGREPVVSIGISRGAGKSLKFPSTGLRPWLWLFRRYAAMKPNGQTPVAGFSPRSGRVNFQRNGAVYLLSIFGQVVHGKIG